MAGNARRAGSFFAGMSSCSVDLGLIKFVNHHGLQEVAKILSTLDDCTIDEKKKAFAKMVSDFNSKPLIVDEDQEDEDDEDEDEDKDKAEGDEGEEDADEDEADGKACEPFGDTKVAGLVKRLHAPAGDELEPKKPRIAESSCVHGTKLKLQR